MTTKGNALVSILVLLLGIVFIYFFDGDTVPRSIVFLCGLTFVVPALILLLSTFMTSRAKQSAGYRSIQIVCGVGGLALGACIMLLPDVFRPLLLYPFALLLIVGGAFQILLLSRKQRPVDYPAWMFIIPVVVIIAGVVMLSVESLRNPSNERWVILITGISAVLYGVNGVLVSVLGRQKRAVAAATPPSEEKPKAVEEHRSETKAPEEHKEPAVPETASSEEGPKA